MLCLAAFSALVMRILECQAGRMDESDEHDPLESKTLDSYHALQCQTALCFSYEQIIAYYITLLYYMYLYIYMYVCQLIY